MSKETEKSDDIAPESTNRHDDSVQEVKEDVDYAIVFDQSTTNPVQVDDVSHPQSLLSKRRIINGIHGTILLGCRASTNVFCPRLSTNVVSLQRVN